MQEPQITIGIRNDTVDVCEGQNRSLIIVYVQDIAIPDSILGYNIELQYNPDKLYLTDEIFSGTLTESFNDHKLTFPEAGIASGWAVNTLKVVKTSTANQPLIAMRGRFLGDCNDTVQVRVKDISFVHVKNDDIIDIDGRVEQEGLVVGVIRDKSERHIAIKASKDILHFTGIEEAPEVAITLENASDKGIDTIDIELQVSNADQFLLTAIEAADEKVEIIEKNMVGDSWFVKVLVKDGWTNLLRIAVGTRYNRADTGSVVLRPTQVNACACVTQLLGSSIELQSQKKIEVHVEEDRADENEIRVWYYEHNWQVSVENSVLTDIQIVDILGQSIVSLNNLYTQTVNIDHTAMARGVYVMRIRTGEHNIKTITIRKL